VILALDSSTLALSLAVGRWRSGTLEWLVARDVPDGGKHGISLPLALDQVLLEAGGSLQDLTALAVGLGPGSFTGLRVGLATLKGLAYAQRLPLAGASSLRALARAALVAGAPSPVAAVLDARHGELYAGLFEGPSAAPLLAEMSLVPERLAAALGSHRESATLVGEGIAAYRPALERDFRREQLSADFAARPQAKHVAELCLPVPAFSLESLFRLEPSYVRASEPEIKFPQGNFVPREGF
jgi:tRNA threonylcarbamoyladenosine biosynthesis protein TsaB